MRRFHWSYLFLIPLSGWLTACVHSAPQPTHHVLSIEPTPEEPTWAFTPEPDTYAEDALLDLRNLNEDIAGETGFVQLSEDGRGFTDGNGNPLRFWAANSQVWEQAPETLSDHAKFLAKRGVNMVRWHGNIPSQEEGTPLTDINLDDRERLWQYVAAMKDEGIYMTLSPYYSQWLKPQPQWPVPRSGEDMDGLLFFDPELQAAYKEWLKQLLEPVNPYTGLALKDDPAIAIIQLQNEDSLLFWTFQHLKGDDLALLRQQFGEWLIAKYGSLDEALAAWDKVSISGEDGDQKVTGLMGFYPLWELTKAPEPDTGKAKRLADQTAFLTETMRQFNAEIVRFLREEIGTPALINAGNWKTANPVRLNDAERYSYTVAEVIGVNRYYGSIHEGDRTGWAITTGDRFTNESVLQRPWLFPLNLKQVANHPMIVSESSWVPPLNYQSEGPFLISVFQSLTGVDGFYWFTTQGAQWRQPSSANGHFPSIGKWVMNTPELMGNFPAAALVFRKGYIQTGEPVLEEFRSLDELWQRQSPLISETRSFDPNRDESFIQDNRGGGRRSVHPLAFLAGPVEVTYDPRSNAEKPDPIIQDLSQYIDEDRGIVRSVTGEVMWDYERGLCWVDAPKAQGVTGFLADQGTIDLTDISVTSGNHYGTLWVVPLDDQAIASSDRLLVQVGTRARPTNWQETATTWTDKDDKAHHGFEIVNYGEAPWQVVEADMQLTLRNTDIDRAIALDMNGIALNDVPLESSEEGVIVSLPPDVKYIILENTDPDDIDDSAENPTSQNNTDDSVQTNGGDSPDNASRIEENPTQPDNPDNL